jgi:hypothetical protein
MAECKEKWAARQILNEQKDRRPRGFTGPAVSFQKRSRVGLV